ncbi:MAG: ComEC/Rec2 family competence protein [Thalassovita sp.]
MLACGIGGYFSLSWEPSLVGLAAAALLASALAGAALRCSASVAPLVWALALISIGFAMAGARAHVVGGPVVQFRYYGPIQGQVIALDRSSSDALRVTLDQVILSNMAPQKTPRRVRVSLHGQQDWSDPFPGDVVMMTGHLTPPSGPAEPGGFDFRRHAWFQKIGAVGYTRTPMLRLKPPKTLFTVGALRMRVSDRVRAVLPGATGEVATAVMTGDRSSLSAETIRSLRRSNLAHLLAISGLHMGLVAGFVFAALRLVFAAVPLLGLRIPAKKVAAVGALVVAALYLVLSGRNVATERAFIMVAVFLIALVFDRRALSLRAVAVGAILVLVLRPESLLSPGFQMSFAATTGLVAVFEALRGFQWHKVGWLRGPLSLLVSSAVAGLATAPFGAAHFNQLAQLGLPANLLTVPLMGAVVMPAAVLAGLLMPFGGEAVPLWVMGQGLDWILAVAHWISQHPYATRMIASPAWYVLPILTFGALILILWQGRWRLVGILPGLVAFLLWGLADRPHLLIAENASLAGLTTPAGRAVSKPKGAGFVAGIWLENDGDKSLQSVAAARWPKEPYVGPHRVIAVSGKRAAQSAVCVHGDWMISTHPLPADMPCKVFDPNTLKGMGSVAVYIDQDKLRIVTAAQHAGQRLWNAPHQ